MLLGPVFRAELIRTARRRHYYSLRVVYGIVLLLILWLNYQRLLVMARAAGGRPLIADFADFALSTFTWFMGVQLATILILVPALFGGVIADEKQRKTMHYLMASRLSSGEIVLDKLAARLLHVGVFILLGLPVMSLLTLFGGVAWDYVVGGLRGDVFDHVLRGVARGPHLDIRPPGGPGCPDRLRAGNRLADRSAAGRSRLPGLVSPGSICGSGRSTSGWRRRRPVSLLFVDASCRPRRRLFAMRRGPPTALFDQFLWMVGLQFAAGCFSS